MLVLVDVVAFYVRCEYACPLKACLTFHKETVVLWHVTPLQADLIFKALSKPGGEAMGDDGVDKIEAHKKRWDAVDAVAFVMRDACNALRPQISRMLTAPKRKRHIGRLR